MEEVGARASTKSSDIFLSSLGSRGLRKEGDNRGDSLSMGEVDRPISDSELLRIMECPVCNEFPAPPIYSCEKGHFTCNPCMGLLESCSLCEAPFTKVRNFALESIIESSNFKCRNAHLGCAMTCKGSDINRHGAECVFRPLECKEMDCLRRNLAPDEYLEHIKSHHDIPGCVKEIFEGKVAVILNQKEETQEFHPYYVRTFVNNAAYTKTPTFFIMSRRHRTFMCWWAVCLEPEYLNDYKVCFSLETKDNPENFSVKWTLPLQPVWKEFDEIRDTGRCGVMPDTSLLPFYVDEQSWNLKVEFVKKQKSVVEKSNDDYYVILLLILVGLIAVYLSIGLDNSKTLNNTTSGSENQDLSDDLFGYRGFYYKTR